MGVRVRAVDRAGDESSVKIVPVSHTDVRNNQAMSTIVAPAEVEVQEPAAGEEVEYDRPWVVIVWNDPINLMSLRHARFPEALRLQPSEGDPAHAPGARREPAAVVSSGNREKSELEVARLHAHGLWATMQQD